ncbi:tumor susceptibility gene 101 protein isoform X2 [Harmonia axyridis]|uniref:tumor susceptibility gene 101 protein isoform X2 n=1 Tax=Harmonia axyridis TaxID=115357 RepID=UPI001E277BD9|nr:tumor susceptibility gene 101 protein isoform X2 [Harmonia axyridis]
MANIDECEIRMWLFKYRNLEATLREILSVTTHYHGLQVLKDTYIFNDGTPMELVQLNGTIPVRFKGAVYNIPVCIWLMDTHPNNAPICYVRPTADMSIKVSMFVDQNGKIYLPYLHDWKPNTSDLLGLIQVMIVTFGEQPPVFAKPQNKEIPPYPMNSFGSNAYMPYPNNPYPQSNYPGYPSYPPTNSQSTGSYPPPYPTSYSGYPTPGGFGSVNSVSTPGGTGTIKDEHIRVSLLSAIEDKLLRRMKEVFQQNQAELDTLRRTQDELKQGKAKLDVILSKLEKEQNDLDKNITLLKDKEEELDKAIQRISNEEPIDVDEAVTTTAPLYKQLLNAFAEEAALEDAIYYMGEALRCGVVDLDVFLRQVRTLSRKQFILRALMQKCRQKAGLAI